LHLIRSQWLTHSPSSRLLPLCRHLRRRSRLGLHRRQNQRDAVALAALQDPAPGAPMIPPRDPSLWSCFLLVLRFLHMLRTVFVVVSSFSFSSSTTPFPRSCLSCGWSSRDPLHHAPVLRYVWLQVLDRSTWRRKASACHSCSTARLRCSGATWFATWRCLVAFFTGGCNGIGAWVVNSVLNCAILLPFLNFYHVVRMVALLDRSCSSVLRAGKEAHSNKLKSN